MKVFEETFNFWSYEIIYWNVTNNYLFINFLDNLHFSVKSLDLFELFWWSRFRETLFEIEEQIRIFISVFKCKFVWIRLGYFRNKNDWRMHSGTNKSIFVIFCPLKQKFGSKKFFENKLPEKYIFIKKGTEKKFSTK